MKKIENFTLSNGLRVFVARDNSKHYFYACVMTLFGGLTKGFKIDDKKYLLPAGIAHLMEHTLIEKSIYGNMYSYVKDKYKEFNGITSNKETKFYIDTVEDYDNSLVELIKMVNIPNFKEEDLETIKKPIYEEIRRKNDNRFKNYNEAIEKCLLKNINEINTLGTPETLSEVDYDLLKLCHDVFYQPNNQIIILTGNVDTKKHLKLIEDTYNEINKKKVEYTLLNHDEPKEINIKEKTIIDPEYEEIVGLEFKVSLDNFTPYEKVKLTFYLSHFLNYNFGITSDLYQFMIDNKYTTYSIGRSFNNLLNYMVIQVYCFTNEKEIFKERVLKIFKEFPYDLEEFNIWKRKVILDLLLRNESVNSMLFPYIDNIMAYDYHDFDKVSDIESFNIDEYLELLKRIDFSQYVIVDRRHE